jgi:hypothetical protein
VRLSATVGAIGLLRESFVQQFVQRWAWYTAAWIQLSVQRSPLPGCLYCPRRMSEFSTIPKKRERRRACLVLWTDAGTTSLES